jgi:hypothetical protein
MDPNGAQEGVFLFVCSSPHSSSMSFFQNEYIQVGVSKYRVSFFGMNEDGATELEEYYSIIVHVCCSITL